MSRTSGRRSSSRIRETWRSVLSWMHWRRRRNQRELERLEQMLEMFQQLLAAQRHRMLEDVQALMLEALEPMAQAMQRQDDLLLSRTDMLRQTMVGHQGETAEMLMEVLQTMQPPARDQLGLPPGPSRPLPSYLGSAISAERSRRTS